MQSHCNLGLFLWGLFAIAIAASFLRATVINPDKVHVLGLTSTPSKKIVGIAGATLFIVMGIWQIASNVLCISHLMDLVSLKFTFWPPQVIFALFAVGIAVANARQMRPIFRELYVALVLGFAIAAGEAAAFHTGPQAERWFGVAVVFIALSGGAWWLGGGDRKQPSADESSK